MTNETPHSPESNEPIRPDTDGNMIQADGGTAEHVPNPHASDPGNIPWPTPEQVERVRQRLVAENAAASRLFTEGASPSAFGRGRPNE